MSLFGYTMLMAEMMLREMRFRIWKEHGDKIYKRRTKEKE